MTKRLQSPLLMACAALLLFATAAEAQVQRPLETPYISARVGLGLYGGDLDGSPDNDPDDILNEPGIAASGELGYQFTPSLAFGVSYVYGNYPELNTDAAGTFTNAVESRQQIQATFRYFVFPSSRITPYVTLGVGYSFEPDFSEDTDVAPGQGVIGETTDGWGPVVGGGVDLLLGRQFSLFLEAQGAFYFPDDAIDGANPGAAGNPSDDADFDWLAMFGGGARFWFKAAVTEVEATIDCATSLEIGQAGTFTAFVNEDATGPLTYSWDWGDGTTSDGLVATHSYSAPGTYTVTFTATGPANSDTETCLVTVEEPPAEAPVLAACAVTPEVANIGETVSFSATATGTRPISFEWNFGDGTTASTLNATHVYNEVGTYNATLTATNEAGSDSCTLTVTVVDRFCDEVTELNTVFFEPGMSTLDEVAEARLAENLAVLERCPDICVVINAYADSREADPLRLSERRAAAVEAYYVQNGIDADRIVARGLGVAPDDNYKEDQGADSRRAESIPVPCDEMEDMMDDMDMEDDMDMDNGM
jgi:outer membrane protein OmpA-like peptidoglycan-associated protein/outer membrane protein W